MPNSAVSGVCSPLSSRSQPGAAAAEARLKRRVLRTRSGCRGGGQRVGSGGGSGADAGLPHRHDAVGGAHDVCGRVEPLQQRLERRESVWRHEVGLVQHEHVRKLDLQWGGGRRMNWMRGGDGECAEGGWAGEGDGEAGGGRPGCPTWSTSRSTMDRWSSAGTQQ